MSVTFTKLASSITESTVWCAPDRTRIVWIAMLAMADRQGRVWASIPGLANRARVPIEDCELALKTFLAPDSYSRTPDYDGRRIEPIDGGWRLLNHAKYREIRDTEDRRAYQREWVKDKRASTNVDNVDKCLPRSTQAEAEAEAEAKIKTPARKARSTEHPRFHEFWDAYPRKQSRTAALRAFSKLAPSDDLFDQILHSLAKQRDSSEWRKDGGKFIPHASTWINGRRWEDELAIDQPRKLAI